MAMLIVDIGYFVFLTKVKSGLRLWSESESESGLFTVICRRVLLTKQAARR